MGSGFLEPVYQECLEIELSERGISFVAQRELLIRYKGRPLKQNYKPDFVCYDKIIIELKSLTQLTDRHRAGLQLPEGHRHAARPTHQLRLLSQGRIRANRLMNFFV